MLRIRRQQMQALAQLSRAEFEERLFEHLRQLETTRPFSNRQLREQLSRGIDSGCRFFQTEAAVALYCEIVLSQFGGWRDEDHPEGALRMLRAKGVEPSARLRNFELWIANNAGKATDAR